MSDTTRTQAELLADYDRLTAQVAILRDALEEIRREYAEWGDMRESFMEMNAIAERALREIECA